MIILWILSFKLYIIILSIDSGFDYVSLWIKYGYIILKNRFWSLVEATPTTGQWVFNLLCTPVLMWWGWDSSLRQITAVLNRNVMLTVIDRCQNTLDCSLVHLALYGCSLVKVPMLTPVDYNIKTNSRIWLLFFRCPVLHMKSFSPISCVSLCYVSTYLC